jgi:hypothetical protein
MAKHELKEVRFSNQLPQRTKDNKWMFKAVLSAGNVGEPYKFLPDVFTFLTDTTDNIVVETVAKVSAEEYVKKNYPDN